MLHKNRFELDLETCCIGDLCTLNRNGVPWPIIYGVGVNVKTGDIFPAQFNEKGPDMDLRYARTLTGGDNVGVSYKFSKLLFFDLKLFCNLNFSEIFIGEKKF